ncbi:MAG: hypothetical protein ABIF87_00330 [Pseudomonadota bacterium]
MISNIIFTKNRPLQLDGYLESLYRHFPAELIQTYVLYKEELFSEQYQQLFSKYPDCIVVKENDFHSDLLKIISQVDTKYILFGIDDVVYFDSVDFKVIDETFDKFSKDIFGFSLRFSEEIIKKGTDPISESTVAGQTVYSISWTQGLTPNTRYPFELCATIYRSELVKNIMKSSRNNNFLAEKVFAPSSPVVNILGKVLKKHSILKKFGYFYNPNTLESWNCRWCRRNSVQFPSRLYFQNICASAIQVNMVNTSTNQDTDEYDGLEIYTIETLNAKYQEGYRIDIKAIEKDKPKETHCGREYFRLTKRF